MKPTPVEVQAAFDFLMIWHLYKEGKPWKYGEPPSWLDVQQHEDAAMAALRAAAKRDT